MNALLDILKRVTLADTLADMAEQPRPQRRVPKVGDEAWFYQLDTPKHLLGKVVHVWSDTCVNLDTDDGMFSSVQVRDELIDGAEVPQTHYCHLIDLNDRDEQPPLLATKVSVFRLEEARALPEVEPDAVSHPIEFAPDSIQTFKGEDRRTMRIVVLAGGALIAQQEVTQWANK